MTPDQVKAFIDLAKAAGCLKLRVDGFEVCFSRPDHQPVAVEQDLNAMRDLLQTPVSEEEVLFWSAGGSGAVKTNGEPVVPGLVGEDDAS